MSMCRQTWALIKRFCICQRRTPFATLVKFILWPGLWLFIYYKFVVMVANNTEVKSTFGQSFGAESYISTLLMLTITFNLYSHIYLMVTDKSSGMKSLMISVGLKKTPYYLANLICFTTTSLPVVLFIGIVATSSLFDSSDASKATILSVFILYWLHMSGLLFVFKSLFKVPSLSSLVLIATSLEPLFHYLVMLITDGAGSPDILLFIASANPYESVRLFTESYVNCRNNGTSLVKDRKACISSTTLLFAMSFWIIIAYMFAIWFDEACPWQTDTANQGLFYCFKSLRSSVKDDTELPHRQKSSKYFEHPVSNRQVGIAIKNVTKKYSGKSVVDSISFDIYRGETTLLLGHNGAGKTTLMNIILGKLMPDRGRVQIDRLNERGADLGVGVCPQSSIFDTFLSVKQHLQLFSDIKSDLEGDARRLDIESTLHDVSLDKKANSLPSELSGGMRRKLSLGMAFVGKSSILILDEPSSGLDPDSRVFIWNAIRRYRADRTVLLSTQHMEEADYLGDRIAIMSEGKIICCGSNVFLTTLFGSGYKLRVECLEPKRAAIVATASRFFAQVKQSDNEHIMRVPGHDERVLDMVLELTDGGGGGSENNSGRSLEDSLIGLLEEIETNGRQLGIRSHGLKSSSIEDVMLNTSKLVDEEQAKMILSEIPAHISMLTSPVVASGTSQCAHRTSILAALMKKHLHTYRGDWMTLVLFRIVNVAIAVYLIAEEVRKETSRAIYSPSMVACFIVFHMTQYPIVERASGFKTMQLASWANHTLYWLSQLLTDLLTVVFAAALICGLLWNWLDSLGLVIAACATLIFGLAGSLYCYVLSSLFREPGSALTFVTIYFVAGGLLTGFLIPAIGVAASLTSEMEDLARKMEMFFVMLYPTDAFRYSLHGIVVGGYVVRDADDSPTIFPRSDLLPPLATGLSALLGQMLLSGLLLHLIESHSLDPNSWLTGLWSQCLSLCRLRVRPEPRLPSAIIDEDVVEENRKAMSAAHSGASNTYSLVAAGISKSYLAPVKVVDGLSVTVSKGECFGLLGVNGAGKSTTFSMLVAERRPDTGRILVHGLSSERDKSAYMRRLGYDPQANPGMSLSAAQALALMARLRRVDERAVPRLVSAALEVLEMGVHADKRCSELSGGTMRKLSLGMSLVGCPELVALDEPTAGVDPIARRSIWQLLRALRSRRDMSVVISSHAMEECEAICDRISIMARGRLRCVGTFLHLRQKFARGCSVRLRCSPGESVAEFASKLVPDLAGQLQAVVGPGETVKLEDSNMNSATFSIAASSFKRSALFRLLRQFKRRHPSVTYMVNDSSLEDIFIAMAQEQQNMEQHTGPELV